MAENFHRIAYYFSGLGLITQLVLIALQIKTYRATRHRSLLLMVAGSVIGVAYLMAVGAPTPLGLSLEDRWSLYLLGAFLVLVQAIVAIGALTYMFRAFEMALAQNRTYANGAQPGVQADVYEKP